MILITCLDSRQNVPCFQLFILFIYLIFYRNISIKKKIKMNNFHGSKLNIPRFNIENVKNSKYSGKSNFVFKIKIGVSYTV